MTTVSTTSRPTKTITRAAAVELIAAARNAAAELGVDVAVAVVDGGGHLRAFEAMDDVPFLAHSLAIDKAWTAAAFRLPSHVWNGVVQEPATAQLAHVPRLVAVAGGYPTSAEGMVIGALGVSGGSAEQDQQTAEAALTALGFGASVKTEVDQRR